MDLKQEAALVKEQIRAYFDDLVPQRRRQMFSDVAKRHFKDLWDEIENLKITVNADPIDHQAYMLALSRYRYVSKELIRKTAFLLHRSILP